MDANVSSNYYGQNDNVIYIDLLNFSGNFFDIPDIDENRTVDFQVDIENVKYKVKNFIHASSDSGYKIICFIDKSITTKETFDKWKARRTNELEVGKKNVMTNKSLILGSIFQSHGIRVHFTISDYNDTIAAFAYHRGGSVLSSNCDFLRYYVSGRPWSWKSLFKVFFNYNIVDGSIVFDQYFGPSMFSPRAPCHGTPPREIMTRLPRTEESTFFLEDIPSFLRINNGQKVSKIYKRGCGSNLTNEENPHLQARDLRRALYSRIGKDHVLEIIANWNTEAEFTKEVVTANDALNDLLDDPLEAFKEIFGPSLKNTKNYPESEWKNHIFCCKSVIAELCAWAKGGNGTDFMKSLDALKSVPAIFTERKFRGESSRPRDHHERRRSRSPCDDRRNSYGGERSVDDRQPGPRNSRDPCPRQERRSSSDGHGSAMSSSSSAGPSDGAPKTYKEWRELKARKRQKKVRFLL